MNDIKLGRFCIFAADLPQNEGVRKSGVKKYKRHNSQDG